MRKAAGVILIIFGALGVIGLVRFLTGLVNTLSFIPVEMVPTILIQIVPSAFFVIGGVFCLRRKHWGVCLASASFAALIGVFVVVILLLGRGIFLGEAWFPWIEVIAAVISVIFISRTRKEWQEISDSVDGEVSYVG
jgi:hypothetical protein